MASYTPCTGSGEPVTGIRQMNAAGLGSKLAHLHGKWTGHCLDCGRSVRAVLSATGARVAPNHKEQRDA